MSEETIKNREPTEKQIWAVDLITTKNPNLKKPDFTFEAYRSFISEHQEEYEKYKQEVYSNASTVYFAKPNINRQLDNIMQDFYFSISDDEDCSIRKKKRDCEDFWNLLDFL